MATSAKKQTDGGADDWDSSPKGADDWDSSPKGADDWDSSPKSSNPFDLMGKFNRAGYQTKLPDFVRSGLNGGLDAADTVTLGNMQYNPTFRRDLEYARAESPAATKLGRAGGMAAMGMGSMMLPGGPIVLGGAQGALTRPEGAENYSPAEDAARRGVQGAVGAGTGAGLSVIGAGLGKVGDWAMQNAVNLGKYVPGMGARMADEGLWGTRGMMQKQINGPGEDPGLIDQALQKMGFTGKLAAREAAINKALPQVQGNVPSAPSVSAVSNIGAGLVPKNPNIPIDTGNMPFVRQAEERALEAAGRGNLAPTDALDVARKIDKAAYDTSMPAGKFGKTLAKSDSGAIRGTLKDMATEQGIPEVASNLSSEQALINARNGMDEPIPLQKRIMNHVNRGLLGAGVAQMMGHGLPGTAAGVAATELAASPLGMSTIGQFGTKASQALPYMSPAAVDYAVRKAMVNQ